MKQIVIIGDSAAGVAALEAIRKKDKQSKITVISDEDCSSYCRCVISDYLVGKVQQEQLIYRSAEFFSENNAELILNKEIIRVNPKKNRIIAEDKTQFNYDDLLLANGASPKFPDIKGSNKRGVFGFRTIKDTKEILGLAQIADTACILGGGLIGLKAAYGLKKRGLDVKVIIKSKQVLSQVIDEQAASLFRKRLEENGIQILTGLGVEEILGNGDAKALKLDSGKVIGCQIIIVAKGVGPNIDLVKDTDIQINEGILVDEYMKTNIPNIYAAGDVCETYDIALNKPTVNALWPNAIEQGKVAGKNIVGEQVSYDGSLGMNSVEFFDLPLVSMGVFKQKDNREVLVKSRPDENIYKKLVLEDNRLVGGIFVGNINQSGVFLKLIREKIDISSIKDRLLNDNFGYPDIIELMKEEDKIYV